MIPKEIRKDIFWVGSIHWERRLFDELIPLPDGTSYNAYFVKGENANALIDTVDPEKSYELFQHFAVLEVEKLDYIVINHAEQDHSGTLPDLVEMYPEATVVTNKKCAGLLETHHHIPGSRIKIIEDREKLDLGGKVLEFILTPWVHWPETMSTYLHNENILFSCDFFGSHMATSSLWVEEEFKVLEDAKRYYAEIMMPFRTHIQKNLNALADFEIDVIAPSHGPLWQDPSIIMDAYCRWTDEDEIEKHVLIPYVSMHDSTRYMVELLVDALMIRGIKVTPYDLTKSDLGEIAMHAVDASAIIVGTPTVLAGPHPSVVHAVYVIGALRPKTKYMGIIGSFGWGGKTVDILAELLKNVKAEILEPLLIKGFPTEDDVEKIEEFADLIRDKVME